MGLEPAPSVMASGMGESMCAASYSLFSVLSRMTAQPAVLTTSTFRPCFEYIPIGCAMIMGVAQVIGMKPTFRLAFSGAPLEAKASAIVAMGKIWASAAAAVELPTAFRKTRRVAGFGNSALIN